MYSYEVMLVQIVHHRYSGKGWSIRDRGRRKKETSICILAVEVMTGMVRRGGARLFSISGSPYIILHCLLRLAILGVTARFPTDPYILIMFQQSGPRKMTQGH